MQYNAFSHFRDCCEVALDNEMHINKNLCLFVLFNFLLLQNTIQTSSFSVRKIGYVTNIVLKSESDEIALSMFNVIVTTDLLCIVNTK